MTKIDVNECTGCGACADACPQNAINVDDKAVIDKSLCVDCGACIDECPADAISE